MIYFFIAYIVAGIIWGTVDRLVAINRGYITEGAKWFWLGFFFEIFAVIVAFSKPRREISKELTPNERRENIRMQEKQKWEKILLENGGWKCACGAVNANYISICQCGRRKPDVLAEQRKAEQGE